jgi:hypothetical protein
MSDPKTTDATVWLIFRETSDKYGTSELVGVFLNETDAAIAQASIIRSRSYVLSAPVGRLFQKVLAGKDTHYA